MTPRDLGNIHTTGKGTHFHARHGTKTTPVFLHADGGAAGSLLPDFVSLLSDGTVQPENTYSCIHKVTGQFWESQKRISIDTYHSYHQRSSPQASFNWSNNKIRFNFNQPNRKRLGARLGDVIKHLTIGYFYFDIITRRVANQG